MRAAGQGDGPHQRARRQDNGDREEDPEKAQKVFDAGPSASSSAESIHISIRLTYRYKTNSQRKCSAAHTPATTKRYKTNSKRKCSAAHIPATTKRRKKNVLQPGIRKSLRAPPVRAAACLYLSNGCCLPTLRFSLDEESVFRLL